MTEIENITGFCESCLHVKILEKKIEELEVKNKELQEAFEYYKERCKDLDWELYDIRKEVTE